ncbi:MAG: hypothetical protein ABIH41_00165 [Nanoarchaeota archaeon]
MVLLHKDGLAHYEHALDAWLDFVKSVVGGGMTNQDDREELDRRVTYFVRQMDDLAGHLKNISEHVKSEESVLKLLHRDNILEKGMPDDAWKALTTLDHNVRVLVDYFARLLSEVAKLIEANKKLSNLPNSQETIRVIKEVGVKDGSYMTTVYSVRRELKSVKQVSYQVAGDIQKIYWAIESFRKTIDAQLKVEETGLDAFRRNLASWLPK